MSEAGGRDFPLAEELPVELMADGRRVAVLMCTPSNLDDLAIGHLFCRGMLVDRARVLSVGACADRRVMSVTAPGAIQPDRYGLGAVIASGCGSASTLDDAAVFEPLPPGFGVSLTTLKAWSAAMFRSAELYRASGGMHIAALAIAAAWGEGGRPGTAVAAEPVSSASGEVPPGAAYFIAREDVGRHNAVDKVLGRGFMDGVDFSRACVLTSGRIAADMLLKAVAARVPILVSRSVPTTGAYEIAHRAGVTLVGRVGDATPIVYTSPERIRA